MKQTLVWIAALTFTLSCKVRKSESKEVSASLSPVSISLKGLERNFVFENDGNDILNIMQAVWTHKIRDEIREGSKEPPAFDVLLKELLSYYESDTVNKFALENPYDFVAAEDFEFSLTEKLEEDFVDAVEKWKRDAYNAISMENKSPSYMTLVDQPDLPKLTALNVKITRLSYAIKIDNKQKFVDNAALDRLFGEGEYRSPTIQVGAVLAKRIGDSPLPEEILRNSDIKKCFKQPVHAASKWSSFEPGQLGCSVFQESKSEIVEKYFNKVILTITLKEPQYKETRAFPTEDLWRNKNLRVKVLSGLVENVEVLCPEIKNPAINSNEFMEKIRNGKIVDFGVDVFNRNFMNFLGLSGHSIPIGQYNGKKEDDRQFDSIPELKNGPTKIIGFRNSPQQSEAFYLNFEKIKTLLVDAKNKRMGFPFPDYTRVDLDYETKKGPFTISSQVFEELTHLSKDMRSNLVAELPKTYVLIYNGHSGSGANVKALLQMYDEASLDSTAHYLLVINGCNSFDYIEKDILKKIRRKAPKFEVLSHKFYVKFDQMVDITANTISTILGSSPVSYFDFLAGLPQNSRPISIESPDNTCYFPSYERPHDRKSIQEQENKYHGPSESPLPY